MADTDEASETLCFDMYGTICDTSSVTTAPSEHLDVADGFVADVDALWRRTQLRYAQQVALMDDYRPFGEGDRVRPRLRAGVLRLRPDRRRAPARPRRPRRPGPVPDAVEALAALGERYEAAVLSNGDPEMLDALAANAGLAEYLDAIVSAHGVRTFKPDPAVYENAADRLDCAIGDCRLVSSNPWDVAGAASAGMATAWVNRTREPTGRVGGDPDLVVASLAEPAESL